MTNSFIESISSEKLLIIRIIFALFNTSTAIFDASYTGWKPFMWYFSDWCLFLTIITQWGVVLAHFFPKYPPLSNIIIIFLQMVTPLQLSMTILYWVFFYTKGSLHWSDASTYVHPIFLYLTPCILLLIDLTLNTLSYTIKPLFFMIMFYLLFIPFTYIGKYYLGYFPYPFITWNSFSSFVWLFGLGILHVICFGIV